MVKKFLDQLEPLADGTAEVPMKVHFGEFTEDVISKVWAHFRLNQMYTYIDVFNTCTAFDIVFQSV